MKNEEAIKILKQEKLCVLSADACDHDCGNCPLVLPDVRILEAYDLAIEALERVNNG